MKKYIELDSLWKCETCFHHRSGSCSPKVWCENGESYRPDYTKLTILEGDIVQQEWFPVSEPPKERGRYLCYFKYEPESPDVVCENTYYGSGHWMSERDRVTHWAYLPKLPEGN